MTASETAGRTALADPPPSSGGSARVRASADCVPHTAAAATAIAAPRWSWERSQGEGDGTSEGNGMAISVRGGSSGAVQRSLARTACARRCREKTVIPPPPSSEIRTNRGFVVWRREARGRVESRHSVSTDIMRARQTESERSSEAVCGTDGASLRLRRSRSTPERASCEAGCGGVLRRCEHQSEQVAKQVAAASLGGTRTRASKLRSRLRAPNLQRRLLRQPPVA